jgi:hypothetical protein
MRNGLRLHRPTKMSSAAVLLVPGLGPTGLEKRPSDAKKKDGDEDGMPPSSPSGGKLAAGAAGPADVSGTPTAGPDATPWLNCGARLLQSAHAAWHVRLPGNQVYCEPPVRALLKTPPTLLTAEARRMAEQCGEIDDASDDGDVDDADFGLLPWSALLASPSAMLYNGYPMPDAPKKTRSYTPEYWRLPPAGGRDDVGWKRVVALDCEMVGTPQGDALARLAVVDEVGRLLYSSLVGSWVEEKLLNAAYCALDVACLAGRSASLTFHFAPSTRCGRSSPTGL